MEFIKVRPEKFGLALGYLDDQWMRIREEAKRRGEVLSYHRIQETALIAPGVRAGDPNTVVLLTEYKNLAAFSGREKLFASIREHLPSGTPGVHGSSGRRENGAQTSRQAVELSFFLQIALSVAAASKRAYQKLTHYGKVGSDSFSN